MIRILGINSSPRIRGSHALYESHCAIMLQGLMDTIRESCNDCHTEMIHLSQMNIHPCRACFSDMETRCHYLCDCFDDDFSMVAKKMIEADGIFFASPTYMFGMAGILKQFLERWISFKAPPVPRENATKSLDECFDLVIMDLTVPGGMGGHDCLEKIKEIDPNVKAIVTSAYFNDPIMNNYIDYGFLGMLRKPFRIMEISQLLYNMLSNNKNMTEFKSNN